MTETESQFTDIVFVEDAFREGKLSALKILYQEYLEAQVLGVEFVSLNELLNIIRTLILNLGGTT